VEVIDTLHYQWLWFLTSDFNPRDLYTTGGI